MAAVFHVGINTRVLYRWRISFYWISFQSASPFNFFPHLSVYPISFWISFSRDTFFCICISSIFSDDGCMFSEFHVHWSLFTQTSFRWWAHALNNPRLQRQTIRESFLGEKNKWDFDDITRELGKKKDDIWLRILSSKFQGFFVITQMKLQLNLCSIFGSTGKQVLFSFKAIADLWIQRSFNFWEIQTSKDISW